MSAAMGRLLGRRLRLGAGQRWGLVRRARHRCRLLRLGRSRCWLALRAWQGWGLVRRLLGRRRGCRRYADGYRYCFGSRGCCWDDGYAYVRCYGEVIGATVAPTGGPTLRASATSAAPLPATATGAEPVLVSTTSMARLGASATPARTATGMSQVCRQLPLLFRLQGMLLGRRLRLCPLLWGRLLGRRLRLRAGQR